MAKMKTLTINGIRYEVNDFDAVQTEEQDLSEAQQEQARKNINAGVNEADYYTSLSEAVADLNNGVVDNAITDMSTAKIKVFTSESGIRTVMLLADVSESVQIDVTTDMDIMLNGKTLTLTTASAYLNFAEGIVCGVYGEVEGSAIIKECDCSDYTATVKVIMCNAEKLTLRGGTYRTVVNTAKTIALAPIYVTNATEKVTLEDCVFYTENTNAECTSLQQSVQTKAEQFDVKNSELTCIGTYAIGIRLAAGSCTVKESVLYAESSLFTAFGLYANSGTTAKVNNSEIKGKVTGTTTSSLARGITSSGTLYIENSKVLGDAPGDDASESNALGFNNGGIAFLKDTDVTGTLAGLQNMGEVYVDGGIFTGYSHGGFYFSHGSSGVAYINDATIRCANYEGEFDYTGDNVEPYGGFYVGGGTEANCSNMTVHLDGCTIGEPGYNAFVLRATDNEASNTVNISNSAIVDGAGVIRIDSGTNHQLNVGFGTNITADKIGNTAQAAFTEAVYRKKHPDAVCNGKDFATLVAFLTA